MNGESSNLVHGTPGTQQTIEQEELKNIVNDNENQISGIYAPSPKHEPGHNWGTPNPIKTQVEGQSLLNTGYHEGKQVYNITNEGKLVKFQPDNHNNGYHAYQVFSPPDIPPSILKKMYDDGKISKSDYRKYLKGKK